MESGDGFIKLSRKFFSNKMWTASRAFSECEAWLDLIQSARFEASETTSRVGIHDITWRRGQYPAATSFLAKRWGWSDQNVKTFLKKLKREEMITTDSTQGVNVITLCNFDEYNSSENSVNQSSNQTSNQLKELGISDLQKLLTNLLTNPLTNEAKSQPVPNQNNKKDKNNIKKLATIVANKESSPEGEAADAGIDPNLSENSKTWRESFDVYKADLDSAYHSLLSDESFAAGRLKFYKNLDVRLSLEKAYADYWSTEAGWKKKKASRSKDLNWTKTFINALDIKSNRVYVSAGAYVPATESQIKFTSYLQEYAPMMLNMPIQPNDEEIDDLRKMSATTLRSIVEEINNNRYLTNGRNSVYQTIMEQLKKYQNG